MYFRFSIDDNIIFLKDIAENNYSSIFENAYLSSLKKLHDKFDVKIQLNLFYQYENFNLSQFPDKFRNEWLANSEWLNLSFHSLAEFPIEPYKNATSQQITRDCELVESEIIRFAGKNSLNHFTTIHFCEANFDACAGLANCGIIGLIGLFGTEKNPQPSYFLNEAQAKQLRKNSFYTDTKTGITFMSNSIIINCIKLQDLHQSLAPFIGKPFIEIMIHEQYFYPSYHLYQPDFIQKISTCLEYLNENNYTSILLTPETLTDLKALSKQLNKN